MKTNYINNHACLGHLQNTSLQKSKLFKFCIPPHLLQLSTTKIKYNHSKRHLKNTLSLGIFTEKQYALKKSLHDRFKATRY